MAYQYIVCHPLTRQQLAPQLRPSEISWSETVMGSGSLTAKLAIPKSIDARARLALATEPDESAIYVRNADAGRWPWGGVITQQDWDPDNNVINITAIEWRQWLFDAFLGPKLDLTADNAYNWTATDQLAIARAIVGYATAGGTADGRPSIALGTETSGKLRDLSVKGLDFKYAGELIDTIANRSGGFEWGIEIVSGSDGLPSLRLALYYPQRGGPVSGLLLNRTPNGGNMKVQGVISKSTAGRKTRVWTTGVPETLPFAVDSDPAIPSGFTLLRERTSAYSTVSSRTTLASHARAERTFLAPKINFMTVRVSEDKPPVDTYSCGDRARLIYEDAIYNIDLATVRIVSRTVRPFTGGGGWVDLTIDLSDNVMPEVDAGGAV